VQTNTSSHDLQYYVPRNPVSARALVWSVLAGIALTLPGLYIAMSITPDPSAAQLAATEARRQLVLFTPLGIIFKALLLMPIFEEIFYRGLILQMLRRFLPLPVAVAIPTTLFAATHLGASTSAGVFALLFGSFAAWLAIRSRSIVPGILCHAAANLSALFIWNPIFHAHDVVTRSDRFTPLPVVLLIASGAVLLFSIHILRRELTATPARDVTTPLNASVAI
jgi:membrane protease YdiL (CAAX protease family)